jgi:glycosyltransferase involved in cell wall biosynthesis
LVKNILKFGKVSDVLVEFEFASYGDTKTTGFFPLVVWFLRILGKRTTLVLHQVLFDISLLSGHIGFTKNELRVTVFNWLLKLFYLAMGLPVQSIIVLEEEFRKRLQGLVGLGDKVYTVPHGVDTKIEVADPQEARQSLKIKKNDFVLLYFGYLTWYKGADFLVKTLAENKVKINGRPVKLIMAGGESTTQKIKVHYQNFVKKVYESAKKSKDIAITGFVKESEIPLYFAAADLVVLPYRTFMSSSGPLSLTFSNRKPFILSRPLESYFNSADFQSGLAEVGLTQENLIFDLNAESLISKIGEVFQEDRAVKLAKLAKIMAQKRDFSVLARQYELIIAGAVEKPALRFLPKFLLNRSEMR